MYLVTLRGPLTVVNTTITAGTTSQVLQTAKTRSFIEIQNTSAGDLWINFGAVAAIDSGIKIATGVTWNSRSNYCPNNTINIMGATTGQKFSYSIF